MNRTPASNQTSSQITTQNVAARFIAPLMMLFAALVLSGCVSKILESKVAEPAVYVLHAGTPATATVAYPASVGVALPTAAPGLDVNRIAVLRNRNQLDYFYGARWGAAAPHVVQSLLVSYLQSQQGLKSVSSEGLPVNDDYLLALELRDFQAEYVGEKTAPTVRVTLSGSLINIKSRTTAAPLQSSVTVAARDNRLGEVVAAFESATQQASGEISAQVMKALAR